MRQLRLPDDPGRGPRALAARAAEFVRRNGNGALSGHHRARENFAGLRDELGCEPLAWLLSDPDLPQNDLLLGLLACEPGISAAAARNKHALPAEPRVWPAFNAGTQGDFASYLLSGLGRLSRCLDYKGFIIILDEMEKWQDLNWKEQSRAGNLLGGLIWGASAEEGRRGAADEPRPLGHSGRCGGYPFTTPKRCHVGIAIAMTPRGPDGPESDWSQYGLLEIADLPTISERGLLEYGRRIAPRFATAYGLEAPAGDDLRRILEEARSNWVERVDFTTRWGVQAVIAALDAWRDRLPR
jgi:hypothetical protein